MSHPSPDLDLPIRQPVGFPPVPKDWEEVFDTGEKTDGIFRLLFRKRGVTPRRVLIIVHGFGEHGARYAHFPHFLKRSCDWIWTFDLRGHGRSQGLRGHIDSFDTYLNDIHLQIEQAREQALALNPACEVHLFGHSMGGFLVLLMLLKHRELAVRSACVSAPFLGVALRVPFLKTLASHALNTLWSTLQLDTKIDGDVISRDPAVIEAYETDRLNHSKTTPRWFRRLNDAWAELSAGTLDWKIPTQFQVPTADRLVKAERSLELYRRMEQDALKLGADAPHHHLIEYPDSRHEAFNDFGKEQFFEDLEEWILKHSSSH